MNNTELLAMMFSERLRVALGVTRIQEVNALNARETDKDVCHSHAFCDPNEVMLQSFKDVFERELDLSKDIDLVNAAWTLAKRKRFYMP